MARRRTAPALALLIISFGLPKAAGAQPWCGTRAHHPRSYDHVVWIWMENHSFSQIIGSSSAPFINSVATGCGLATNYHNITHVSLPNYIGAVTGLPLSDPSHNDLQPFLVDCLGGPTGACLTGTKSLFTQVSSWKAYMESMTTNCQPTGFVGYATRHNPPPFLTELAATCATDDVPYTALQADLDGSTLPAFSFISPDTVDDMHDGGDPTAIQNGDAWLTTELPKILNSSTYQQGKTVVFVNFDEGENPVVGKDCATNTTDDDCHVATIVISPYTPPGTQSARLFNHYSLLRTTERLLGVPNSDLLGRARRARNMRHQFRL